MGSQYSVWIDVEDIFLYFETNSRPGGIQRVVYEILRVIRRQADIRDVPIRIRLIRRHAGGEEPWDRGTAEDPALFTPVAFNDLERAFEQKANPNRDSSRTSTTRIVTGQHSSRAHRFPFMRRLCHTLIQRVEAMPPEVGNPLLAIVSSQLRVARLALRYVTLRLRRRSSEGVACDPPIEAPTAEMTAVLPQALPQPGDVFLILGATWSKRDFGERLRRMRVTYGIEPVLLVYDLVPALRPEWCARSLILDFRHWLDSTLPQCGRLLAISQATARSVEAYARDNGLSLTAPVQTIPIGSGFGPKPVVAARPRGLPPVRSYVLFVSTLEPRKNHALAFLVWQRLLSEMPPQEVPTLVFAGREGWLVGDLIQQIENTDWLRGKIRLLRDPTDDELSHLYEGCLFTLFTSLFEGWGLPVTESLDNGAPCIASNSTSIPEAGGLLTRYFDPENADDAYRVVRETLANPAGIARWRQEVCERFEPVLWTTTADAVLDACDSAHRDRRN